MSNVGIKHDEGKSRMDLLDPEFLLEMGRAMRFGITGKGYGEHDWKKGIVYSRFYAAILRHALKFWKGETLDKESGLKALAHLAVNAMMLASMPEEWDDRSIPDIPDFDDEIVFVNVDEEDQDELEEYLYCKDDVGTEKHSEVDFDDDFLGEDAMTEIPIQPRIYYTSDGLHEEIQ